MYPKLTQMLELAEMLKNNLNSYLTIPQKPRGKMENIK